MNRIDGFFTENIEQFSQSYFSYLKEIIDKVDSISLDITTLLPSTKRVEILGFPSIGK